MIALGADQLTARRRAGRRTRADEVDVRVPTESTPAPSPVLGAADDETYPVNGRQLNRFCGAAG